MGSVVGYCETCGKEFKKYRSFQRYCSGRCRYIATEKNHYGYEVKPDETKKCKNCEKEFVTNNKKKVFCCYECYRSYRSDSNTKKLKKPQSRLCPICGHEFKSTHFSKKYCCNDCYKKAKKRREKRS